MDTRLVRLPVWTVLALLVQGCATLTIGPDNRAPVAVDDTVSMAGKAPAGQVTLAWDDLTNPSEAVGGYYLYYWQPGSSSPVRLDVGKQTTYTLPDLQAGQTYTFAVTAHDGSGGRESAMSNVLSQLLPNEILGTRLTVGAPGVLSNDSDADGDTLRATLVRRPVHGTLTLNTDGSFTYLPHANFSGTDSFTYQATDGTLNSNVAMVTINTTLDKVSQLTSFVHLSGRGGI